MGKMVILWWSSWDLMDKMLVLWWSFCDFTLKHDATPTNMYVSPGKSGYSIKDKENDRNDGVAVRKMAGEPTGISPLNQFVEAEPSTSKIWADPDRVRVAGIIR